MARTKAKNSTNSFGGYGLTKAEDAKLIKIIKDDDTSGSRLVRKLLREFIKSRKT